MSAFTEDIDLISIPYVKHEEDPLKNINQVNVSSLNIKTKNMGLNKKQIPSLPLLDGGDLEINDVEGGFVEFWPYNYSTGGSYLFAGNIYDTQDQYHTTNNYGSMQIHHRELFNNTATTLFAFNGWNRSSADLGVGNQVDGNHPDWTFAGNANDYSQKTIEVFIRPSLDKFIQSPLNNEIIQRDNKDQAEVDFVIDSANVNFDYKVKITSIGNKPSSTQWVNLDVTNDQGKNVAKLTQKLPVGWYHAKVQRFKDEEPISKPVFLDFGVGDVFITAGQSNSTHYGQCCIYPDNKYVTARILASNANDFQSWSTRSDLVGKSPWYALGDKLSHTYNIPVGFVIVGVGGTSVEQWSP